MTCHTIQLPGGAVAIACTRTRGRKPPKCSACKKADAEKECDFPKTNGASKTCDAPLCRACAIKVGPNRDFCPSHWSPP